MSVLYPAEKKQNKTTTTKNPVEPSNESKYKLYIEKQIILYLFWLLLCSNGNFST